MKKKSQPNQIKLVVAHLKILMVKTIKEKRL